MLVLVFVTAAALAQGAGSAVNVYVTGGKAGTTAKVNVYDGGSRDNPSSTEVKAGNDKSVKTKSDAPQRVTVTVGDRRYATWMSPIPGATVSERVDLDAMPPSAVGPGRRDGAGTPVGVDGAALRRLIQDAQFAVRECNKAAYDRAVADLKAALKAHEDYLAKVKAVVDELRGRTKIEPDAKKVLARVFGDEWASLPESTPMDPKAGSELGAYYEALLDLPRTQADLDKIKAGLAEVPPWSDANCPPKSSGSQQATPSMTPPPTTPQTPPTTPPKAEDGLPLPEKYKRFGLCQPARPDGEFALRIERFADRAAERAAEHAIKAYYASGEAKIANLRTSEQWLAACNAASQLSPSWRGAATPVLPATELQKRTQAADRLAGEIAGKARDDGGRAEAELYGEMAWGFHCYAAAHAARAAPAGTTTSAARSERSCRDRVDRLTEEAKAASPARRIAVILMLGRALSAGVPTAGGGGHCEQMHAVRGASGVDAVAVVGAFLMAQELLSTAR